VVPPEWKKEDHNNHFFILFLQFWLLDEASPLKKTCPPIDAALYVPPESPLVAIALGSGGVVVLVQDGWMRKGVLFERKSNKKDLGGHV